eukprot:superscaffoldBa00000159_g2277
MAAEMSCLAGVDGDDKDADSEINALTLLQEPVRMAQESASCNDSFGKPSLKQNSVLDVLSNTDMLSPVGLGNGPSSHQATQAHELNNISTEKEEEKSITPLKTVQEIDTAGIWGFDESPENSLDNFSSASDIHWDPHKEFMQFLWENHGDSPGEEPKDEVLPPNSQRRRKRKMDMVVMVDPSEDLYPDMSHKSSEDLSDAEGQVDSIPVRKASKMLFEKIKTEEQDQSDPEIKEECIETEVFQETFDSHPIPLREPFTDDLSELESDRKTCPYCPAIFESGVGLSNHVRGHLHRVGLSYNARHVVPPEQVASQDRRPRIRRKISAFRRLKKALQLESESETVKSIHSCPLCGDSFDNRTGQSNHIRGHLKKLGKSFATKNKSPLFLLRELMRDKKEFQRALQILGKRRNHFQYGASPKLSSVDRFTPTPIGITKNNSVSSVCTDAKPLMPTFSLAEMESEKRQLETKLDVKNSLSGTNALIGILKKRKCQEDSKLKGSSQMSRNMFCDLVFQGPLSVQEDWIKHLQRHIMNTSVPHTGLGMVEVTSLPTDPPTLKTDQDSSLTAAHAAS